MESDNGRLLFALGIDTSGAEAGKERSRRIFDGIARDAARAGASVDRTMAAAGKAVGQAAAPMAQEIGRLEKAYRDAFEGMASESAASIRESISEQTRQIDILRAKASDVAGAIEGMAPGAAQDALRKKLEEVTESIEEEEHALKGMRAQYDLISGGSAENFRTQMTRLRNALAQMRDEGRQDGEEYRRMEAELGKLSTRMREVQAAARMDSTGATQWHGMIEGVQGLMGAYTALSGVVGAFTSDQEKLMRIQTRMQSLMSVLMGMQQVANTLHSTSTFRLRTLAAAQELYNVALAKARAALLSGSQAARIFKIALASTGVGALVVVIGALVAAFAKMRGEARKAEDAVRKQGEELKDGRKAYADAAIALTDYKNRIKDFNGTREEEKALVSELNGKYGEEMGYFKTIAEWKERLASGSKAYCDALREEALAQAYMNKWVEAYIAAEEAADLYRRNPTRANARANNEAVLNMNTYREKYGAHSNAARSLRERGSLGGHSDPDGDKRAGAGDAAADGAEKAARERVRAREDYAREVAAFIIEGEERISRMTVDAMEDGLEKELAQIDLETRQKKAAWTRQADEMVAARREADKRAYLAQDGNTEDTWEDGPGSKKSDQEYRREIFYTVDADGNAELTEAGKRFYSVMDGITEEGERKLAQTREKYNARWVQDYGSTEERIRLMTEDYAERIAQAGPEYAEALTKEMNGSISALTDADFRKSVDWEGIFGDLGKQSLPMLEESLGKVKRHFEDCKDSMGTQEIKDYQEAIARLRDEMDSRNPFIAFHNSIREIGAAKDEYKAAMSAMARATMEQDAAMKEYNAAAAERNALQEMADEGKIAEDSDALAASVERTAKAEDALAKATEKAEKAQSKAQKSQNRMRQAYADFKTQLGRVANETVRVAEDAKGLAAVFSDDVAEGIGKAVDFTEEVMDSAQNVIGALNDVAKSTMSGIEGAVSATSGAVTATAAAGATAISTIEKASVILAVISAAMQVAMAIANLFNNDKSKQKQIEALQDRIDDLQWEMDNANTVRLEQSMGKALDRVRAVYHEAYDQILAVKTASLAALMGMGRAGMDAADKAEALSRSVEKIADAYANVSYTADKALGGAKYDNARNQLKNLAEQQVMIQRQIELERSKKKTDKDKIKDWEKKIAELGQEMADVVNGMTEDIIGGTSDDIAKRLGDAFSDAFARGEDAARAWGDEVNDIVRDIVRQMLVRELLEKPLGNIFNEYKKKWFGDDGTFKGFDAVNSGMEGFAAELNALVTGFQEGMEGLPQEVRDIFTENAERSASSKGIATASQDSVDELNGRATAIQGHTYSIAENTRTLTDTAQQILRGVMSIEGETSGLGARMERMEGSLRAVRSAVEDISMKGIKIK